MSLIAGVLLAAAVAGERTLGASALFVPPGIDGDDEAQVVIEGLLEDGGCVALAPARVTVSEAQWAIFVEARAREIDRGACLPQGKPFAVVIGLGVLPEGDWQIITNHGWLVENLHVYEPLDLGTLANVEDLRVERRADGRYVAVLAGRFASPCERLAKVLLQDGGRTLELAPVLATDGAACAPRATPFTHRYVLPRLTEPGRHLLRVRTGGGAALTLLFDGPER